MAKPDKYLLHYAEAEAQALAGFNRHFECGLVIPVYRESVSVLERFCHFAEQHPGTLLLLVLNRPDDDLSVDWLEPWLAHDRLSTDKCFWQGDQSQLHAFQLANDSGLLIIDRATKGAAIPKKQGVGLARKVGADILYALIQRQNVRSSWIANTDADALLPDNYFSALAAFKHSTSTAACVFPFAHIMTDSTPALPTLLYEFSLHYYVNGLQWAGSPYAFHTIGSIIAVQATHYAQVRGFPKRSGAEDFYLLNKLAKTGQIVSLEKPEIHIIARHSSRVPFGTGPATASIAHMDSPLQLPLYHPECFHYLRFLLLSLQCLAEQKLSLQETFNAVSQQHDIKLNQQYLLEIAENIDLEKAVDHSYQHGKTAKTRLQHLHQWFDGFKTLKFIHWFRDEKLGVMQFQEWIDPGERNAEYIKAMESKDTGYNKIMEQRVQRIIESL